MFKNRQDAAEQLALAIEAKGIKADSLIIALPRGGVVVGAKVAELLHLPLDVVCPRKVAHPNQPEYAIGAVTEDGSLLMPKKYQELMRPYINEQIKEAKRRALLFRQSSLPPDIAGKHLIVIDDGLATGLTMEAAVMMLKKHHPASLTLAVPCGAIHSLQKIQSQVDQVICLIADEGFMAVGQYYQDFSQTSDDEVITLLSHKNS